VLFNARFQAQRMALAIPCRMLKGYQQLFPQLLTAMARINIDPFHLAGTVVIKDNGTTTDHRTGRIHDGLHDDALRWQRCQIEQMIALSRVEFSLICIKGGNQGANTWLVAEAGIKVYMALLLLFC
jgi:hypothetical protein